MTSEEIRLKIQALVDNELSEDEIPSVMSEIEGSYELREEYVSLLRLRKKMSGLSVPEPAAEWFEKLSRRKARTVTSFVGMIFFVGSYVLLVAFAVATLLREKNMEVWIKVGVIGIIVGVGIYLIMSILDRIRESKTDKYKEVMR